MRKWNGLEKHKKKNSVTEQPWYTLSPKVLAISLFLLSSACSKKFLAEAPKEAYDINYEETTELSESYLTIPLNFELSKVEHIINNEFKGLIHDDQSFKGDDIKLKIWKLKDIHFQYQGEDVYQFEVPLKIWVQKRIRILGSEQKPESSFEIIARFSTKPAIANNWKFTTNTTAEGFNWVQAPKLSIGGFSIPIQGLVSGLMQEYQIQVAELIDQTVRQYIDLETPMEKIWNNVQQTFQVSSEYDIWLDIQTKAISMEKLKFDAKVIHSTMGIHAFIRSKMGSFQDSIPKNQSLPSLTWVEDIPDDFTINIHNLMPFETIEKMARNQLIDQKIEFRKERKSIEITTLKVYGAANNKLVMKAAIKGDLKGTLFLACNVQFASKEQSIIFKDVEIDLKTKDLMHKVGSWVLEGQLEKKIENEFSVPINFLSAFKGTSFNSTNSLSIARDIDLNWTLKEINPGKLLIVPGGIGSTFELKGALEIKLP